jgi:TIR domain
MKPIKVFYSYAHEDEGFCEQLEKHLSSLRHQGLIEEWHDRMIFAGTDWEHDIDRHLNSSSLILLLISPDFMQSKYCMGVEVKRAMELHESGEAYVVPIILKPVDWEGAPFAKLQVLPATAKPISTWDNQDDAFLNVSRGIRKYIENLQRDYLARMNDRNQDITRLPAEQTSYFMSLENYLKPSRFRAPTNDDFERDLVYVPEKPIAEMARMLHVKRRLLLTGAQAAGKTVLAIILARHLQEQERYKVAYSDADKAKEGDGFKWYRLMRTNDREGVLYILDNCHLAPQEVNDFCLQWDELPPEQAQCLLISRAHAGEEEVSHAVYHYFEACGDETIKVHSEDVYWGMIKKYAAYYQLQNAHRYAPLVDSEAEALKKLHGHDLVVSKGLLEAWSKLGGRLSDVKRESTYDVIRTRYFSRWRETLPKLCALRQFEIRAHNLFVESQLPRQEVISLQEERLLTGATERNYGMLYDLTLHSAEAREIFRAYIYYQRGRVSGSYLLKITVEIYTAYLKIEPPNYVEVYEGLARQKQKRILKRLLEDPNLQECAARQFEEGTIIDAINYLSYLQRFDAKRARELLAGLIKDIGVRNICVRMLGNSFQEVALLLQNLRQIELAAAVHVVTMMDLQYYRTRVEEQHIQSVFQLVQVLNEISPMVGHSLLLSIPREALLMHTTVSNLLPVLKQLRELEYPPALLKQFVEALDIDDLVVQYEHGQRTSLSHLYQIVKVLEDIFPLHAKLFLEKLSLEQLQRWARVSNMNLVRQLIEVMRELKLPQPYVERLIVMIGVEWFVQRAEKENLQHLYWLLLVCKRVSPAMSNAVLEALSPGGLAALCLAKEVSISALEQFNKVSSKPFWKQFLGQFTPQDMAAIFKRSPLGAVGSFLKSRYFYFRLSYRLFRDTSLEERLRTESLEEIGKFLARIGQIPEAGDDLVYEVVDMLVRVDISERVASSDLNQFALLLYNGRLVHHSYLYRLMGPLKQSDIMHAALVKSELTSIQLLIHNVASIDGTPEKLYVQTLHRALHEIDLKDRIITADPSHIAMFLWNVYHHIDRELALKYCLLIDRPDWLEQLDRGERIVVGDNGEER